MSILKKITSCIAGIAMITALMPNVANAEDFSSKFGADYAKIDEVKYQEYINSLSKEEKQALLEKEVMMRSVASEIENNNGAKGTMASWVSLSSSFLMYQQETSSYCGPACVKSMLMYVNGSSPSQSSIDSSINGNFTQIPSYVNSRQSNCLYSMISYPSQTSLIACIYVDINSYNVPPFLRIQGTTTPSWYYATNGHCIVSKGVYSDYSKVRIGDPLGDRVAGCPYYYDKSAADISTYTTHVCY